MKLIKELSHRIEEELCDAEWYVTKALENRDDRSDLADTYYALSLDEMKHMTLLHNIVVKLIEEVRKSGKEIPVGMEEFYDYLHQNHIEKAKEVRILQAMYRE